MPIAALDIHNDSPERLPLSEGLPIIKHMSESLQMARRMTTADLHALLDDLLILQRPTDDTDLISQLDALERLKAGAAAAQARLALDLANQRTGSDDASISAEIALARRESPHAGGRHLHLARALVDLPATHVALSLGDLSEARAMIIATETQHLSPEDRRAADAELAAIPGVLDGLGDAALRDRARTVTYRLDDEAATRRQVQARDDRHVTGRVLGDGTARITAVVGQEHFAAVIGALDSAASSARAAGDPRTHSQVKADTLVERVTGIDPMAPATLQVDLVIGIDTLIADDPAPGNLAGPGVSSSPLPATLARALVAGALRDSSSESRVTLRRLFVTPQDRELIAMESRARTFPKALAEIIDRRDAGRCRTPYCNALIRHCDHVVPDRDGGPTDLDNGQGLCERCNYTKEQPGWISWVGDHGRINTLTPAAHVHTSRPPPLTQAPRPPTQPRVDFYFPDLILAA
jgi:hypothetical protein